MAGGVRRPGSWRNSRSYSSQPLGQRGPSPGFDASIAVEPEPVDERIVGDELSSRRRRIWIAVCVVLLLCAVSVGALVVLRGGTRSPKLNAAALVANGLRAQVAGDLASAGRDYSQAIADDPKNKFAYYNLGLIQQTAGDKVGAENSYRAALSIDRTFPQALYNLAILRTAVNSLPEAIDLYRRAIAASPKAADAHFNLGLLLRQTGNTAEGNSEVQAAVKLDPSLAPRAKAQGIPLSGD
jgi:Tfp pilus assembly protein PilF